MLRGRTLLKGTTVILMILAVTLAMSCSPNSEPTAGLVVNEPQTTITFMSYWGGSSPYRDLVEETIAGFMEKYPHISVVNESLSQGDYLSKLKNNFATGYIPDVFLLWPSYDLQLLFDSKQVASLKPILTDAWKQNFFPIALEAYYDYTTGPYGIPFETVYLGLYVNKRIFYENDLTVPKTYEDLLKAVVKLNRSGVVPIAYSADLEGTLLFQAIIGSLAEGTSVSPQAELYSEAMLIMRDLYNINAFPQNAFILSGYEQNRMFLSGEAAMMVQGSWFSGDINTMDDPVEVVQFPVFNQDASKYNIIGQNGYSAFHASKKAFEDEAKREAVKDFLTYFTSKEVMVKFVEKKGMIAAANLPEEVYGKNRFAQRGKDLISGSHNFYCFPSQYFSEQTWREVFINNFPYMLENRLLPEELLHQAEIKHAGE